ncbi:hypothetical protein KAI04_03130 [Candidatus Pacearchaeota archaeon]|nr:hypothetical protein [Candidatus Pacearchaeota archaeon]
MRTLAVSNQSMVTKSVLFLLLLFVTMNFASATITENITEDIFLDEVEKLNIKILDVVYKNMTKDLFSDEVTKLDITISNNQSEINFFFNSTDMSWDKFSIYFEVDEKNITVKNLFLSSLLDAVNFKIENKGNLQFTYFHVEEGSVLYSVIDLVLEDYTMEELNNITLVNQFIELDNKEVYHSFEKTGNNFIYQLSQGYDDVNISEVLEEAVKLFNISGILSELLIENIYDLNFTVEIQGIDELLLENGYYELELVVNDGEFNKIIGLTLEGFEEVEEEEVEEEVEEETESSSSSRDKVIIRETEKERIVQDYHLATGTAYSLTRGDKLLFNIGEESHSLKIDSVTNLYVFFTLQSDPITFNLEVGEIKSTCLSDNESFTVRLLGIEKGEARIYISSKLDSSCSILSLEDETNEGSSAGITGAAIGDGDKQIDYKFILYFLIALVVITLFLVLMNVRRKKRFSK